MKHVHIDMVGGIAGDMFLAAALDAGLIAAETVEAALTSIGVGPIQIVRQKVHRGAFSATHIRFTGWDPAEERDHRYLTTIIEMLDNSGLSERVRARAKQMFYTLGESEARIHDMPLERVHFHECGALDSIFDFVAAALIIEESGATWSAGAVPTGSGTTETDHGTVPLPVPATAAILEGFELVAKNVPAELVTPTGATILRTLRELNPTFERPRGIARGGGYGAGTRDLKAFANVVRFLVLEVNGAPCESEADTVTRLACDIDDMNPELFQSVEEALFEAGALDVVREAILMKKGRQATRLSVLCKPDDADHLAGVLFRETTTFGIRVEQVARLKLARSFVCVQTPWGEVQVKVGARGGKVLKATPEYADCARLAREHNRPVREVYEAAQTAWRRLPPRS